MAHRGLVFIAAHSRSGSTLLEQALAAQSGVFAAGELRYIWVRGLIENQSCGCGQPFSKCEFWRSVIGDAFGQLSGEDVQKIALEERRLKSPKLFFRQVLTGKFPLDLVQISTWAQATEALIESIFKISSADFVIDSSKTPTYGMALSKLVGAVDFRAVHLVRDPRAVAYSRIKPKRRPEVHWKTEYMATTKPGKSALQWDYFNLACELFAASTNSKRISYEDFVDSPRRVVSDYWLSLKATVDSSSWINERTVVLGENHTVSGNPIRFKKGEVVIAPDDRWRKEFPAREIKKVSALAFPLMLRYGYGIY